MKLLIINFVHVFLLCTIFKIESASRLDLTISEIKEAHAWIQSTCAPGAFSQEIDNLRTEALRILGHLQVVTSILPSTSPPSRNLNKWITTLRGPINNINDVADILDTLKSMHENTKNTTRFSGAIDMIDELISPSEEDPLLLAFHSLLMLPAVADYTEENIRALLPAAVQKLIKQCPLLFPKRADNKDLYDFGTLIREKYVDQKIESDAQKAMLEEKSRKKLTLLQMREIKERVLNERRGLNGDICTSYATRFAAKDFLALCDLVDELERNGLIELPSIEEPVQKLTETPVSASEDDWGISFTVTGTSTKKVDKRDKKKVAKSKPASGKIKRSGKLSSKLSSATEADEQDEHCPEETFKAHSPSLIPAIAPPSTMPIDKMTSVIELSGDTGLTPPSTSMETMVAEDFNNDTSAGLQSEAIKVPSAALSSIEQIAEKVAGTFYNSWLNRRNLSFIDDIFDTAHKIVSSTEIADFFKNLVKKQTAFTQEAKFSEGSGSHKLAVLVSEAGKKVLFPFAHHAGQKLDRHSRDMIIDGFKTLFGISK